MRETIKEKVSLIVDTYKTRNPKDLAKKNKITVMYRDLGEIKGFFRDVLGKKFIAINENMSDFMINMILAHELGHYFLHSKDHDDLVDIKDSFLNFDSVYEKEANQFAAYLLFSEDADDVLYYPKNTYEENIFKNLYKLSLE
jgi:hypothetical protein